MPREFSAGDAAIQRSNANAQSVLATGGSSGSGAATVSTRQAKIDASRGARQTRSIATGIATENALVAPPGQPHGRQDHDAEDPREHQRPDRALAVAALGIRRVGGSGGLRRRARLDRGFARSELRR